MSTTPRHRIVIDSAFQMGAFVILRIDPENEPGMIVGINLRPTGLFYDVAWPGPRSGEHYEIELREASEPAAPLQAT